jgi:DNA-binding XRE family transcriptional regulator
MPRVKTSNAPTTFGVNKALIQVRKSTYESTRSQKGFADAVGINGSTYQTIEEGKRQLTQHEAADIMAYTGADPSSVIKGKNAKTLDGRSYSRETFKQWVKRPVPALAVDIAAKRFGLFVEEMVRASFGEPVEAGELVGTKPERYRHFIGRLWKRLSKLSKDCGLQMQQAVNLRGRVYKREKAVMSLAAIQRTLGIRRRGGAVLGWDYQQAEKHLKDSKTFEVTLSYSPILMPLNGISGIGDKRVVTDASLMDLLELETVLPWSSSGRKTHLMAVVFRMFATDFNEAYERRWTKPLGQEFMDSFRVVKKKRRSSGGKSSE